MGCCSNSPKVSSPPPKPTNLKENIIIQIPIAKVHLVGDQATTIELSQGSFSISNLTETNIPLATIIKIGDLRWPLTKDEPVVKLDRLHYLFTVPDEEAHGFLNYGVSFARPDDSNLASLDRFLKENSCFSDTASVDSSSSATAVNISEWYWKDYVPNIEDYNGVLAKAIAQGTGEIVKGIFKLSSAYSLQVQKGANMIKSDQGNSKKTSINANGSRKAGGINRTLKRARKLSETMEKMSQALLNGVLSLTENLAAPLVQSKVGKSLLATFPGEVLLASLDAVTKVLEAVEFAEKRAFVATSGAVTGVVSKRLGESAGEATENVLATAGHAIGTTWNVFKIRKAINPKASVASKIINDMGRKKS